MWVVSCQKRRKKTGRGGQERKNKNLVLWIWLDLWSNLNAFQHIYSHYVFIVSSKDEIKGTEQEPDEQWLSDCVMYIYQILIWFSSSSSPLFSFVEFLHLNGALPLCFRWLGAARCWTLSLKKLWANCQVERAVVGGGARRVSNRWGFFLF